MISPVSALLVALSGMVIVFLVLAVLSGMIVVISKVVALVERRAPQGEPAPVQEAAPAAAPQGPWGGEVSLIDVDEKTAACVMAIVSHETGIPLNELVFKTIKAL